MLPYNCATCYFLFKTSSKGRIFNSYNSIYDGNIRANSKIQTITACYHPIPDFPFLLSINLTDRLRGSTYSSLAKKFQISGQEFFVDPLSGPIFSEQSKRINKINYCKRVMDKINKEEKKSVLICGWWYNELVVANLKRKHKRIIKITLRNWNFIPLLTNERCKTKWI